MSLIAEALEKAQRESAHRSGRVSAVSYPAFGRARPSRVAGAHPFALVTIATVLTFALLIGAIFYFPLGELRYSREPVVLTPKYDAPVGIANPPAASPPVSVKAEAAPTDAEAVSPPPPDRSPDYVLTGMTAIGRETLVSVTRLNDQHSVWIPVGKTVGQITVVSYDAASDRAVIRVNGRDLTIELKGGQTTAE